MSWSTLQPGPLSSSDVWDCPASFLFNALLMVVSQKAQKAKECTMTKSTYCKKKKRKKKGNYEHIDLGEERQGTRHNGCIIWELEHLCKKHAWYYGWPNFGRNDRSNSRGTPNILKGALVWRVAGCYASNILTTKGHYRKCSHSVAMPVMKWLKLYKNKHTCVCASSPVTMLPIILGRAGTRDGCLQQSPKPNDTH